MTIAVLKSVQINQTITFLYNQAFAVTTRVLLQTALNNYYTENLSPNMSFPSAHRDLQTAVSTQSQIFAARVYTTDMTLLPNLTVIDVDYPLPDSLNPTGIPRPPDGSDNTAIAGALFGPVQIPDSPGTYALSLTIPIMNTNDSSHLSLLGWMSTVFTASGIQRAVNDRTGMGQTGQVLVVARNQSRYEVIIPPARTPRIHNQEFKRGQYPAVDLAFDNHSSPGYLINTHDAGGYPVSVGYHVFHFFKKLIDCSYQTYGLLHGRY